MEKNDEDKMITLTFDDGTSTDYKEVCIYEVDNKQYIALYDEEKDEIYLYGYSEDENGNPELSDIETDEEFEKANEGYEEYVDDQIRRK